MPRFRASVRKTEAGPGVNVKTGRHGVGRNVFGRVFLVRCVMSSTDSYVDRRSKGQVFATGNEGSIQKALAAKANAVRRLERQGRRAKFSARLSAKTAFAA